MKVGMETAKIYCHVHDRKVRHKQALQYLIRD